MNISIITVHLDDFEGLIRTFHSLQALLSNQHLSWVVIDGGSHIETDDQETGVDLIKSVADFFSSEPDRGIYDAMNKGCRAAKGDYVLFLNAGDEFAPRL